MSIVRCELHGNIDTDFDAEHFIEGTEICTESAMTPEDIKKVTPEGYGGDFEQTAQVTDMKQFHIPIKIVNRGTVSIMAASREEAIDEAEKTIFWAYQSGAIEDNQTVSITDVEAEVDGEDLDLDNDRWGDE